MSRSRRFITGLASSWVTTLVTVGYGLASVPLALSYLSVEEFGLFMLLLQMAGYFTLIELGMGGASARILVDHKDDHHTRSYGSVILTGSLVFALQGAIILLIGLMGAPWIVAIAGVPANLHSPAVYLLRWLCASFAFATTFRILSSILYANKRLDFLNAVSASGVLFGLACMAAVFACGGGLRGLALVFSLQSLMTVALQALVCWRLRLFPSPERWGKPTFARFTEMFGFAKDVFLVNLGNQILEASQIIIVTRTMGLTAAAIWSVGTKIFNLLYQVLTRIEGTAIVFFSEMMVRGETDKLKARFRQIYQISAGLAAVSLAVAVAVNKPFVSVWAEPALAWALPLSAGMAVVVFLNVVTRCHVDLILHTKKLFALRYVYFFEAVAFVSLAFLLVPSIEFYGVLVAAASCLFLVRFWYTSWRIATYLDTPLRQVCWGWLQRPLFAAAIMIPFAASSNLIVSGFSLPLAQFVVAGLWVGIPATVVLMTIALPRDTISEGQHIFGKETVSLIGRIRKVF